MFHDLANRDGWTYISRPDSPIAAMAEKWTVEAIRLTDCSLYFVDGQIPSFYGSVSV
ncbi:MAG: hypothetical protein Q8R74_02870 [Methylophilus sp.]|nr:hypothetical protein [Methylophilus sp.]